MENAFVMRNISWVEVFAYRQVWSYWIAVYKIPTTIMMVVINAIMQIRITPNFSCLVSVRLLVMLFRSRIISKNYNKRNKKDKEFIQKAAHFILYTTNRFIISYISLKWKDIINSWKTNSMLCVVSSAILVLIATHVISIV